MSGLSSPRAAVKGLAALFKKRWVRVCTVLLTLFLASLLALPYGMKRGLEYLLMQNGADKAFIDRLSFNPFLCRLTLKDIQLDAAQKKVFHNAHFSLDFSLLALFKKQIRIERAEYDQVVLDIEQLKDGKWRVASYLISPQPQELVPEHTVDPATWHFLADKIAFKDCQVILATPELKMVLAIKQADLETFSTMNDDKNGRFSFQGTVNGAPLTLELKSISVSPSLLLEGNYELADFKLKELSGLFKQIFPTFTGTLAGSGDFTVHMSDDQGLKLDYSGKLGLKGLHLVSPKLLSKGKLELQAATLALDGPISLLVNKALDFKSEAALQLADWRLQIPDLNLAYKEALWKGALHYADGKEPKITSGGSLSLKNLQIKLPEDMRYTQEGLSFKGKSSTVLGKELRSDLDGELRLAGLDFSSKKLSSKDGQIDWKGAVRYTDLGSKGLKLMLHGNLTGSKLQVLLPAEQMQVDQDSLQLKINGDVGLGKAITYAAKGSLQASKFAFRSGGDKTPLAALDKTATDFVLAPGPALNAQKILLSGLVLNLTEGMPQQVSVPEVEVQSFATKDMARFAASAVRVRNLQSVSLRTKGNIGSFKQLSLDRPLFDLDKGLSVAMLVLDELMFLPGTGSAQDDAVAKSAPAAVQNTTKPSGKKSAAVSTRNAGSSTTKVAAQNVSPATDASRKRDALNVTQIKLTSLTWNEKTGLQAGDLTINTLQSYLRREKDGQFELDQRLAALQNKQAAPSKAPAKGKSAPATRSGDKKITDKAAPAGNAAAFALKSIQVQGESIIRFRDLSLPIPFNGRVDIQKLLVTNINSAQPSQNTAIDLEATLNQRAPLKVKGTLKPFVAVPEADMNIRLKNYPLSHLSSYTAQAVGLALDSGQLNLTSTMVIKNERIDMKNTVFLKQLETKTLSPALAKKLDNQLPLPLDTAISFLKDNDGNIELDVPIDGPLASFNVGIGDILITAIGKAILPAASSYLMYAMGPYGALAYVGMKIGGKMMQTSLAPLIYAAGETELTADHKKYLERIAKILKDRPQMEISFCPIVPAWEQLSSADRKSMPKQLPEPERKDRRALNQLGQNRAKIAIEYLVQQYKIDASRLMVCETKIDLNSKSTPVVDLQI